MEDKAKTTCPTRKGDLEQHMGSGIDTGTPALLYSLYYLDKHSRLACFHLEMETATSILRASVGIRAGVYKAPSIAPDTQLQSANPTSLPFPDPLNPAPPHPSSLSEEWWPRAAQGNTAREREG